MYVVLQGYVLHQKFVFENTSNNFYKYLFINILFGFFDFILSVYIKQYLYFYSIAFIASSIFTTFLRYFIYKHFVFK